MTPAKLRMDEEKSRHAAGMLPVAEAVERITDQIFAPIDSRPVYVHDARSDFKRDIVAAARNNLADHCDD
jgi:hypothetical protein